MHRGIALLLRFGHVQGWSSRLQQQRKIRNTVHVQYRAVAYPVANRYGTAVISRTKCEQLEKLIRCDPYAHDEL